MSGKMGVELVTRMQPPSVGGMETQPPKDSPVRTRAVLLARCSTPQQVEYSVPRQIEDMQQVAKLNHVDVATEFKLEGVSGLDPEARDDIHQIIDRKTRLNDFDTVIIAKVDRLTRGGVPHG